MQDSEISLIHDWWKEYRDASLLSIFPLDRRNPYANVFSWGDDNSWGLILTHWPPHRFEINFVTNRGGFESRIEEFDATTTVEVQRLVSDFLSRVGLVRLCDARFPPKSLPADVETFAQELAQGGNFELASLLLLATSTPQLPSDLCINLPDTLFHVHAELKRESKELATRAKRLMESARAVF